MRCLLLSDGPEIVALSLDERRELPGSVYAGMLSARSSPALAQVAADYALEHLADGVLVHARVGDRLVLLACVGLPEGLEAALASTHAPDDAAVAAADLFDLTAAGVPGDVRAWPLLADGRPVGRLTLTREGGPPRDPAVLLDALGPALRRSLDADVNTQTASIFEALLPILSQGVIVASSDGELLHYNKAMKQMVGWSAEAVASDGWTNLVYPDPEYRASVSRALATLVMGQGSRGTERWLTREDGQRIRAAIWSGLITTPLGGAPALLGVMSDVTDQEAALQLQRREEGLVKLGERVSAAAHDLNNLLCAVLGHAELLAMPELKDELRKRSLETISRASQSGATIVQGLLIASGTTATHPAPTDIGRLARRSADLARGDLALSQRLHFEQERGLPLAEADAAQLHRALGNLFSNAREASGEGGVITVSVDAAALPEEAIYRAPGSPPAGTSMVRIRVADSGAGFSRVAIANLFVPFYTTKDSGHGIGMGVVQGAVRACRGALDVQNRDGGGATVDLYLPVSDRPEINHAALAASADGRGRQVWLVEENRQVAEFSSVSLSAAGFTVRAFGRGRDAIAAARGLPLHERPDVMVLALSLTDGGPEFVHQLAAARVTAPVVWTSGHRHEGLSNPGGLSAFLPKPYTGQRLTYAVTQLLDSDD